MNTIKWKCMAYTNRNWLHDLVVDTREDAERAVFDHFHRHGIDTSRARWNLEGQAGGLSYVLRLDGKESHVSDTIDARIEEYDTMYDDYEPALLDWGA